MKNCTKKQIRYLAAPNFNCIVEQLIILLVQIPQLYTEPSSTKIQDIIKQVVSAILKLENVFAAKISPDPTQYTVQQLIPFQQIIVIHTALTLLQGEGKIFLTIFCCACTYVIKQFYITFCVLISFYFIYFISQKLIFFNGILHRTSTGSDKC